MSAETIAIPKAEKKTNTQMNEKPFVKGGYFLTADTPASEIFISEEWNEEQRMIAQMIVDFCVKEVQEPFFKRGRELEISNDADKAEILHIIQKAGELGLCGVSIPEAYGGMGLDFTTGVLFSENIAAGFSFATTIGAQTSIGSLPIVFYGTEAQKQKYLPSVASGELLAAYALTEPTAGSDANAGKSKATLSPDGEHYLLNGQKIWITNGGIADIFIVFAKIDDDKDLSAFIVEKSFGGITIGKEEKKMGIKGSSTVQLFFEDCPVPVENLLSERAQGFKIALNILNTGRIKLAAGGVGGGKFSLDRAVDYALERKQFGKTISEFGAVKQKLGEIAMRTFALDAAVYRTSHNIDLKTQALINEGNTESEALSKAVREFAIECAILKTQGSQLACYATDECMQVHGGMGYAAETGLEMAYRDARITRIYEGTNEINRMLSIVELLKRHLQTKELDLFTPGKQIPKKLVKSYLTFSKANSGTPEQRLVQGLKDTFLTISGSAGRKLRKQMGEEQEIILNMADIMAEAFITESVMLKIEKLEQMDGVDFEKLAIQRQMMKLYSYEARDRAYKAAKDAIASYATGREKRMLTRAINKLLAPYEANPRKLRRNIADFVLEQKGYCF